MGNSRAIIHHRLKQSPWPESRPEAEPITVIDACTLQALAQPIPAKYFTADTDPATRPASYLDMLLKLPQDVIGQIYIPDSVVFECTGFAPTGEVIKKQPLLTHLNTEIMLHHPYGATAILHFLGIGEKKANPRVHIAMSEESREYFKKLTPLYADLDKLTEKISNRTGSIDAKWASVYEDLSIKRKQLRAAIAQYGDNLGDIQCAQLCFDHAINHASMATLLSEDGSAQRCLVNNVITHVQCAKMHVGGANLLGMLEALNENGILQQNGIRKELCIKDLAAYAHKSANTSIIVGYNPINKKMRAEHGYASFDKAKPGENFADRIRNAGTASFRIV
jgi:hypothetical protein